MIASPLRVSADRIVLYGALLTGLCLVQMRYVVAQGYGDWSAFWAAGSTVGTAALLDPRLHAQWMSAHHLLTTIFPYLPATAWFLLVVKPLTLAEGYALNAAVMIAATITAAFVAARVYQVPRILSIALMFAWAPVTAAIVTGQNSPIALLLCVLAVYSLVLRSQRSAGLAVGALLYKITFGLPLAVLLMVRRRYRAVFVVAVCAAIWYVLSAAATAWDWRWPVHYAAALQGYFGPDARFNAAKAISIPSLLVRAGLSAPTAIGAGIVLFAAALPLLARCSALEAASMMPLIALSVSPHTLPYDMALALPAIFYVATHAVEPLRTRLVCLVYVIAPLWLLSGTLHFDVLALICDISAIVWIVKGYNESTSRTHLGIAHSRDRGQA